MTTEELDKQKMDVLREVTESSMLVMGLKDKLVELEEKKEEFFKEREQEAKNRVLDLLGDSKTLLDQVHSNYQLVHEFCGTLKDLSDRMNVMQTSFLKTVEYFNENSEIWQKNIDKQVEELIT